MVGIVVVSHSRALARAAVELAQEMTPGRPVPVAVAAGLDENTLGTDAVAIADAIGEVDGDAGVVVLMDLGSAVLSAEMALEFLEDEARGRVLLCSAPLVEGLVAAVVTAAGGAGRAEVAAEARNGLAGKQSQLDDTVADPLPVVSEPAAQWSTARVRVTPAHGLHARPAARLVAELRAVAATVELRNATTDSAWVSAASLSGITTLGLRSGHDMEARATGEQAHSALARLTALAGRNFDETSSAAVRPEPVNTVSTVGTPLPAAPGIAVGPVRHANPGPTLASYTPSPPENVQKHSPQLQKQALEAALAATRIQIVELRERLAHQVPADEAAIFDAHLALLDDPALLGTTLTGIEAGQLAAQAWVSAALQAAEQLERLDDEYLAARGADVRAVGDQVLAELLPPSAATQNHSAPGILVVEDLTPGQAAALDPDVTPAVITAYGSPSGHAAILTRARGIAAIVAAGTDVLDLPDGTTVALDGTTGELVISPSPEVVADFTARAETARVAGESALRSAHQPALTRDGFRILVGANASTPAEATAARAMGADLIGLVRTEFLFLGRETAPGVDEQESAYLDLADAFGGERITLRTLDVGGDKPLSYVPLPAEANPFLGTRGLRLGLRRTDLLTDQLRAIVRTARQTPVSVMFPMVSTLDELLTARRLLNDVMAGEGTPLGLQVGIMVEVPAAALKSAALAPYVDFFSIGTNDLTQYTLAAERGNEAVAALGDPFDPAVLHLVRATVNGAAGQAEVAVCGEFAADVRAGALLAGLGVTELSVNPRSVPQIKQTIRQQDLGEVRESAAQALLSASAQEVRESLRRRS
ncbi:phosphoenolpyruvate--protein phosphotransferase [Kineosporia rhizophila]|uniref:phosphoenolpyruvate--protein phosphotransferase n=1 Tax=Kineosporia rhizophila TaxID=84633 RepID=UPI001E3765FE|nr:phosphoenolpyruvate--protein phosphotransferase [Kineosporia rhizophila]MCE0537119.1 phosphoenolpyruvate--protein phosphotransferase [Kineosporia rhizophila]